MLVEPHLDRSLLERQRFVVAQLEPACVGVAAASTTYKRSGCV